MAGAAPPANFGGTAYPFGARNGTDIFADTGATTALTASIIGTTAGSPNVIIAAVAGKKIRVVAFHLVNTVASGAIQFQDTAGTPILLTGVYTLAANQALILGLNELGHFDTNVGVGINMTVTGTSNVVGGTITYYLH